jgi:hypothetical protein
MMNADGSIGRRCHLPIGDFGGGARQRKSFSQPEDGI